MRFGLSIALPPFDFFFAFSFSANLVVESLQIDMQPTGYGLSIWFWFVIFYGIAFGVVCLLVYFASFIFVQIFICSIECTSVYTLFIDFFFLFSLCDFSLL